MQEPVITLFVAFTRRWALERWLDNLNHVQHTPELANLVLIVDCDDDYIAKAFKARAEKGGYRSFHVIVNDDWRPNETRLTVRRQRVATIKNQSKDLIARCDGDIVIGFEDDTVFDRLESFKPLYHPLLADAKIGFVEGVQMGRWGARMVGAWDFDDPEFPQKCWTLLPPEKGKLPEHYPLEYIGGGGFYGYATRKQLYLDHDYYWSTSQPWGPDVNFGLWLRKRGLKVAVNWSVLFGHNDYHTIGYPDDTQHRLTKITYTRDRNTGKWNRSDHERDQY